MNKNNDIINKFLLVGDNFMPETHLYQPKIGKYSACGPFTKHTQRIQKLLKTNLLPEIYKNELDKACFQHDMSYNKYEDLKGRTQSDIVLKHKAFKIATNSKNDGFQRALASMVWKFFDKRSKSLLGSGIENKQLADELHKPIVKKFKRIKVYSYFKGNIWCIDLADMQLIGKFNKGIKYLLCVTDLFSRYAWIVLLKNTTIASIVNAFQSIFKKSSRKQKKTWVDHDSEFYNNVFKNFLKIMISRGIQHIMKGNQF